jgi:hypothetical protein
MKFSRTLPRLLAALLVFTLMVSTAQTNILKKKDATEPIQSASDQKVIKPKDLPYKTKGKKITVILHGLMVGRLKNGDDKRLEVGVVKRAPEHNFSFEVYEGKKGCTTIEIPRKGNWVFEVRDDKNVQIPRDIKMPPISKPALDNKSSAAARLNQVLDDPETILNIEGDDLHDDTNMGRYKRPFKQVFYFHNGTVSPQCTTVPIEAKRIERNKAKDWYGIGSIAEVVGIEITLEQKDHRLVLRNEENECEVIWYNNNDNDTGEVEGRILNLKPAHHKEGCCKKKYKEVCCECPNNTPTCKVDIEDFLKYLSSISSRDVSLKDLFRGCDQKLQQAEAEAESVKEDEDMPATDFQQYYYLVFKGDRTDRFELRVQRKCLIITDKTAGDVGIATIPPYRCGMVFVEEGSKEIKFEKKQD